MIFLGNFWHSETIFGVITDLCDVVVCLVLPVASRLTIDSEWKRLTTLMIFDWKIEFFRSFLALWDYFWSHNWLMWSCYLPCLACVFSFDDRFWMETTHNPYDFWSKNWFFRSFLALWDYFWSHIWLIGLLFALSCLGLLVWR